MKAYHGLVDQAAVKAEERVAVFACGGVGLSVVNIAAALGAKVVAVSRSPEKLALAEKLGATHTVTAGPEAPAEIVELTGGGAHVSVDALGSAATTIPALLSLRTLGRHLRLGAPTRGAGRDPHPCRHDAVPRADLRRFVRHGGRAGYPKMLAMVVSMGDYETVGMPVITEF
jgi:alcohol dehydrogenase